jgi:predicted permease
MPDWKSVLGARLAPLNLRPEREREIVEELAQHLDERHQDLLDGGTTPEEAMRLALEEIDDEELLAREMRPLRQSTSPEPIAAGSPGLGWLADLIQDVVYAARMLRKNPGFAAAAILTLALGIGGNSAIFSLVNATLLQRLPIANGDRVFVLFEGERADIGSYPALAALRDQATLIDGLAGWGGVTASLQADGETDVVSGVIVSGNFFDLLGVKAARGRLLSAADDITPLAHPVVVISDALWRGRFNARADIVGADMRLNGHNFKVIGVTPPGFPGPQLGVIRDIYVPMMMQPLIRPPRAGYSGDQDPDLLRNPNMGWVFKLVLAKPGIAADQAAAELSALSTRFARSLDPRADERRSRLIPIDAGNPTQRASMRAAATLLGGVVSAVLLIACANIANLLLSRAWARRREMAIRLALGASRARIVRQLLTESVLLALLGGVAGLGLAWLCVEAFKMSPPPAGALPITLDFTLDGRVLAFSIVLSVLTGLLFGLAPALQTSRPDVVPALKEDAAAGGRGSRRFNLKSALVVGEVAISLILLLASGLLIRSLRAVQAIDPGYAVEQLVSTPLNVELLRYTREQGREFYRRVIERTERIPGVESASVARVALLSGGARTTAVTVEGQADPGAPGQNERAGAPTPRRIAMVNVVSPGFLGTLGVSLLRGRSFEATDVENSPAVAVVSQSMVRQFFRDTDPMGRRFSTGVNRATGEPHWIVVIGVARDSKYTSLSEPDSPVIYLPLAQQHETGVTLYVRAIGSPGALAPQIRREIQAIEPGLPVPNPRAMGDTVATSLYTPRMGAMLLSVFGGLALLLATLGIYAVLAFSIGMRRREIGIRMALGADRRTVTTLVLKEGMALVAPGIAIGLTVSVGLAESMRRFLFDVSPRDLTTFAVVPAILMGVALAACYLPARKAAKVDPLTVMRVD